jgi:superfamily II DNA or RNA helicase
MPEAIHSPGTLIRARGREWIVLAGSDAQILRVRPVAGTEHEETRICVALEREPVSEARFPLPDAEQLASQDSALLLRDALLLSLRRGAGPFRSFGQISVEPRAYQLVPLMMALKLDPVRILIADDVGVGKTIEAGLIARELLDRGEIERIAVLCPPHLVDQWVGELEERFHIRAVGVTATNAGRLERDLPPAVSLFQAHPHTVVSLDYIKAEKRRDNFRTHCPEFVIVDEAHTCAATTAGRHQRHDLVRALSDSNDRHMVFLTATPHSGDDAAFYRLLGFLNREFASLGELAGDDRDRVRKRLGDHFVQRRRPDIEEWGDGSRIFPRRNTAEITYQLTGQWEAFFSAVLDYCRAVVEKAGGDERRQRLNFWGTLALLRCASSSPAAAVQALRTRAGLGDATQEREDLLEQLFDGESDALTVDDLEPDPGIADPELERLVKQARDLMGAKGDPKLELLAGQVKGLVAEGFNPVVFCRYIATAHYLHHHLTGKLPDARVAVVTGEDAAEQRKVTVADLGVVEGSRVLVATDCLSEGINLQDSFDAVIHYDLSWNPTRHEQREGRVDRFGQPKPEVRTVMMYGANNPVDGAVLEAILRKAEAIRRDLGVPVPIPDSGHTLSQALMKAVLLRSRGAGRQIPLDFGSLPQAADLEIKWRDAAEKAKQNRTIFAQRRLKPDEVLPEWHRTLAALGDKEDVKRFVGRALARLGSGLEPLKNGFKAPLAPLPEDVRERLDAEDLSGTLIVDFDYPPRGRCRSVLRSHPLVSVLAETLLERAIAQMPGDNADPGVLGRCGCWVSEAVQSRTVVALLRLRHQLTRTKAGKSSILLVEEATAVAWASGDAPPFALGDDALALLQPLPAADPPAHVRSRHLSQAFDLVSARFGDLDEFAESRARTLLADHERVRESSKDRGNHLVRALVPADVIGLFVLLPKAD